MPNVNTSVSRVGNYLETTLINLGGGLEYQDKDVARVASSIRTLRTTVNTPGFHNRHRVGRLSPNPFTFERDIDISRAGSVVSYSANLKPTDFGYFTTRGAGILFSDSNITSITEDWRAETFNSTLDARARNSLLLKLKSSSVNLMQMYAERRQACDLVGNTAVKLAQAYSQLRHGNVKEAARLLPGRPRKRAISRAKKSVAAETEEGLANAWLELQYGWKPLLDDVYGTCDALSRKFLTPSYVTAKVKKTLITPSSTMSTSSDGGQKTYTVESCSRKTQVAYSVTYYRDSSPAASLAQLGISNPALLAWELLPYSFVADWFLPVGDFLSTFDATLGLEFHSGYTTTFSRSKMRSSILTYGVDSQGRYKSSSSASEREEIRVNRQVLANFPNPALPRFKNPLSVSHMLSGLSLLSQIFRKK